MRAICGNDKKAGEIPAFFVRNGTVLFEKI